MASVLSVNLGGATPSEHTDVGVTGIDKRPVGWPVLVQAPGAKGVGGSGLTGDDVCDKRHHGGDDQAVYAYAREDLDEWAAELGVSLPGGMFGENLTTTGLDISGALIGERWRVGADVVLQVTAPRIPCRTFAGWLGQRGWVRAFTRRGNPGAYLRVVRSGMVRSGDPLTVTHRPRHGATVGLVFRAVTTEPELLAGLVDIPELPDELRDMARRRTVFALDPEPPAGIRPKSAS